MVLRLSGGRRLVSPPGETARPTASRVRLAVMNCLARDLPGARWLDLCSGSGVMACEALLRGVDTVVAIERDRRIAAVCRSNVMAVLEGLPPGRSDRSQATVHCMPAERWLSGRCEQPFDLIYADPPYASGLYGVLADRVLRGGFLTPTGTMLWECGTGQLPQVPAGWRCRDQRRYGGTTLMLLDLMPGPQPLHDLGDDFHPAVQG